MFIKPESEKVIKIFAGVEKEVILTPDQYFYLDEVGGNIVIKNAVLDKIARENGVFVKRIELEHTTITNEFLYIVYRAYFDMDGVEQSILGEASSFNLDGDIAARYPFTMAETRATSRAFIKALHLKEAGVYAECEFGGDSKKLKEGKNADISTPEYFFTKEEAGEVLCNVGFYAKNPKPIKEISERSMNWILKQEATDENMRRIQAAIRAYMSVA